MLIFFKLGQFPILALLFLFYTVQALTNNAQPRTRSSNIEEKIQSFVQKLCTCKNIKGLTLAVVQNDRIRMAKGFGYKNLETKEKVDEKTLFGIASLTKAFAATTLAKILPENKYVQCLFFYLAFQYILYYVFKTSKGYKHLSLTTYR